MKYEVELSEEQILKMAEEIKQKREVKELPTRSRKNKGEMYYFLYADGDIAYTVDQRCDKDDFRYNSRNYFLTRGDTEKALELIEIENELCALIEKINSEPECPEGFPDITGTYLKYYLTLNHLNVCHIIESEDRNAKTVSKKFYCYRSFKDEAIKTIGKERLLKYLKER